MGKMPPQFLKHSGSGTPQTTGQSADQMMPAPTNPMNAGSHAAREAALANAMVAKHKAVMGHGGGKKAAPMAPDTDNDGY